MAFYVRILTAPSEFLSVLFDALHIRISLPLICSKMVMIIATIIATATAGYTCRKPKFRGVEEQKNGKGVITGEYPEAKRRGRLSDGKFKEMRTFFRLQGS